MSTLRIKCDIAEAVKRAVHEAVTIRIDQPLFRVLCQQIYCDIRYDSHHYIARAVDKQPFIHPEIYKHLKAR